MNLYDVKRKNWSSQVQKINDIIEKPWIYCSKNIFIKNTMQYI